MLLELYFLELQLRFVSYLYWCSNLSNECFNYDFALECYIWLLMCCIRLHYTKMLSRGVIYLNAIYLNGVQYQTGVHCSNLAIICLFILLVGLLYLAAFEICFVLKCTAIYDWFILEWSAISECFILKYSAVSGCFILECSIIYLTALYLCSAIYHWFILECSAISDCFILESSAIYKTASYLSALLYLVALCLGRVLYQTDFYLSAVLYLVALCLSAVLYMTALYLSGVLIWLL